MRRITPAVLVALALASPHVAAGQAPNRLSPEERQARYQVGQMERMLEGAVEHGATVIRDRLQAIVPAALLLSENARVRGFRLDGYGIFFDVQVPALEGTMAWSMRTLDQNDLGLQSALRALQSHVSQENDPNLEQALKRVEIQLGPVPAAGSQPAGGAVPIAQTSGAPASIPDDNAGGAPADPILRDPESAYRAEVRQALIDAMLDYSGPLGVKPGDSLTIAARGNDDRPRLAPADVERQTIIIRISGADLAAFRAGRLSREDALKHVEVRVF